MTRIADLEDRLRRLAWRREQEGIYTDAMLADGAADRIAALEAQLAALSPAPEAQQGPVAYPRIMYCCDHCSEHAPEWCGHDRLDIYVTNDGQWLCDKCRENEGISPSECSSPPLLYPRPAEQAVTEAMVEAAHIAANNAANNHTYVSEASIRSALRAAMEAEE